MTTTLSARERLDRGYLELRCRIIDLAAGLDRIERGTDAGAVGGDDRIRKLSEAMKLVLDGKPDRAARAQMLFSLPYEPKWRGAAAKTE